MTWQISLASCAAQNLIPGPPYVPPPSAPVAVEWDTSKTVASHLLSNSNKDVENVGVNNLNQSQIATKAIPPGAGPVYFEVNVIAIGANGSNHLIGLYADAQSHYYLDGPINGSITPKNAGCSYSHGGFISSGGTQVVTGLSNLAAGVVLGFIVDAAKGKVWVYRNNVLLGSGVSFPDGKPTCWIRANKAYFPVVTPIDNGDKFRLQSIVGEFTYSLPSGCKAYGADLVNFNNHFLTIQNDQHQNLDYYTGVGSVSMEAWSVNPAGSTFDYNQIESWGNGIRREADGVVNYITSYSPSYPLYHVYPNQSGKTFGGIYQDHVLDERFDDLVDLGQYMLRMSAAVIAAQYRTINYTTSNVRFSASFFDGTDTLISELESPFKAERPFQFAEHFFDVPVGTRKVRTEWRYIKPSAATAENPGGNFRMPNRQARLIRKIPYLRAKQGAVSIILTP